MPLDELDPQIRQFADALAESYRAYPEFDRLPPAEARQVAEAVRRPWRKGGPAMAEISEHWLPSPHGEVRIRVYRPKQERLLPALVYVHGGGWTLFSLDTHDRIMREYAARAGVAVVGVDYALSPEAKFPVALEQVVAVTRWLAKNGDTIGLAKDRLALGGDSVGGNMSLATALILRDADQIALLRGLLLLYGVYDTGYSEEIVRRYGGPPYTLSCAEMEVFWQRYLGQEADRDNPLVRPILANLAGLPPVHMTFGECDILAEQNRIMAERLRAAGVTVSVDACPGAAHSFLEAIAISELASRALDAGARWLRGALA